MSSGLSVIIASHNAATTLDKQLAALTHQSWPRGGEIIVADNGSTDGTPAVVARYEQAPVRVHRLMVDDLPGAGHARNIAFKSAAEESIAFCDADDIVGEHWVATMTEALDDDPVVTGPLDYQELNPRWLTRSRGLHDERKSLPLFDHTFPVASSCNLGIRAVEFDRLGGFDTSYPRAQDTELSLRMWRAGLVPTFNPQALVHYRMRSNSREVFAQARGWGRAHPRVRAQLGGEATRRTVRHRAISWAWLVAHSPMLRTRAGRARWAHVAGTQLGDLEGSWSARS